MNQDALPFRTVPITVPPLGTGDVPITLVTWLVAAGGQVIPGERIAELLVEEIVFQLEAEEKGTLLERRVPAGKPVKIGETIGHLRRADPEAPEAAR